MSPASVPATSKAASPATGPATNPAARLPEPIFSLRCRACRQALYTLALVVASFASLDLHLGGFLEAESLARIGRFLAEFVPPRSDAAFLKRVLPAALETLAMSALGTLLAAAAGLALAAVAARLTPDARRRTPAAARLLLNALRAVPELVWAALLAVALGLGPMAGTLALALHTTGVLGRLFAEAMENAPRGPAQALRNNGAGAMQVLTYATFPQVLPQFIAYSLYRWENNIRAAAVLGVVGAGGLGQMLQVTLGLFQMQRAATVILAMLALVLLVDAASARIRRAMSA